MKISDVVTDEGRGIVVQAAQAVLFAKVSGMNAENDYRKACGYLLAYGEQGYQQAIDEFCEEITPKNKE